MAEKLRALLLRRRGARLALALLLLVALFGAAYAGAQHLSDAVTITVESLTVQGQATVFSATIRDGATARSVQALLGRTRQVPFGAAYDCGGGTPFPYSYDFHFSFLGVPVQDVRFVYAGCPDMRITTLGIPELLLRYNPTLEDWQTILHLTGMPDFGGLAQ